MRIEDVLKELRSEHDHHPGHQPRPSRRAAWPIARMFLLEGRDRRDRTDRGDLLGRRRRAGRPTTTSTGSSDERARPRPRSHPDARPEPLVRRSSRRSRTSTSASSTGMITSLIGPSRLRQDHAAALLQPRQRALRQRHARRARSDVLGKNIYDPDVSLDRAAQVGGHGVPAAEPAADLGLRERRLRPAHPHAARRADAARRWTRRSRRR